jgi:hypothetical protein
MNVSAPSLVYPGADVPTEVMVTQGQVPAASPLTVAAVDDKHTAFAGNDGTAAVDLGVPEDAEGPTRSKPPLPAAVESSNRCM